MVHADCLLAGFGNPGRPPVSVGVMGLVLLTLFGATGPALGESSKNAGKAEEVDTEHMFGFITGTDIGQVGDKELESETTGRLGKRTGSYTALSHTLALEYTPLENVRLQMGALQSFHDISGVPDLDDLRRGEFEGLSLEVRYRLLSREQSGIGLTILAEPHSSRVDEMSGQLVNQYGVGLALLIDKELIPNRLVAAFNLLYDPEMKRFQDLGEWSREATYGVGAGLMNQIWPGFFVGAEARYLRQYESFGFDRFAGHAVFVGPNVFITPSQRWRITATWTMQVSGKAVGDSSTLDLVNFERYEARLRIGYYF
jgi:Family of unknown function (DUF6662)